MEILVTVIGLNEKNEQRMLKYIIHKRGKRRGKQMKKYSIIL